MNFENLSPEVQEQIKEAFSPELLERAKKAQSMEELLDIAEKEGIVLSDEQLELVAGGCGCYDLHCGPHSC
ncbi:MAG: hypothetical protein IJJ14_06580 [Coriobacteriales bacterium]|nr:hypothetical protein [Coriobacteriales bacterium]